MGLDETGAHQRDGETVSYRRTEGQNNDEFVGNTGYCRKYALHLLANWGKMRFAGIDGERITLKAGKTKKRIGKAVYTPQDKEKDPGNVGKNKVVPFIMGVDLF
jgi:hypothetical protein